MLMFKKLLHFYNKRFGLIAVLVIAALVILAWVNRFIQDDAFISFRYAKNLVEGNGLVWNIGERVEGYTNFLWTMLIAAGLYLKLDPVYVSTGLGLAFFSVSLIGIFKLSKLIFSSRNLALIAVVLLGTNYSFSAYATGGLETQLQTCLLILITYKLLNCIHAKDWRISSMLVLSLLMSAALLTRLDSAFIIVPAAFIAGIFILMQRADPGRTLASGLALVLPMAIIINIWLSWKLAYYGILFPNSYYAKVASTETSLIRGFKYIGLFGSSYFLTPLIILVPFGLSRWYHRRDFGIGLLTLWVLIWLTYTVKVGGDFMEFRFLVPVLPFIFILIVWLSCVVIRWKVLQIGLIALLLIGSWNFRSISLDAGPRGLASLEEIDVETIPKLHAHIVSENQAWRRIGETLGRMFEHNTEVIIATTAAGALPYYSGLKTIDMYGLCDLWVAREGDPFWDRPGHQKRAPFAYLLYRGVNIVIAHPIMTTEDITSIDVDWLRFCSVWDERIIPGNAKLVGIPIDEKRKLIALYLVPNPIVDQVIEKEGWSVGSP